MLIAMVHTVASRLVAAACLLASAAAVSQQCAASCGGSSAAWTRPGDGVVPPEPTSTPDWTLAPAMTPGNWFSFPYGDPRAPAVNDATGGVSTGKAFAGTYYMWGAKQSEPFQSNVLGVDVWYTLSFRFRASADNNVSAGSCGELHHHTLHSVSLPSTGWKHRGTSSSDSFELFACQA